MRKRPITIGELNTFVTRVNSSVRNMPPEQQAAPSDYEVTEEYHQAIELLHSDCEVLLITGKAGTGKSTFIRYLKEVFPTNLAVVAPSGVAALNIGGVTIHSFFRFPPRLLHHEDVEKIYQRTIYEKLKILVIDEISMVRADVMDCVELFLRLNGPNPNLSFGGVKLVLVGDFFQLPPVVERDVQSVFNGERYDSPYFFSAEAVQHCRMEFIELTKIFRQSDQNMIRILNNLREGNEIKATLEELNTECLRPKEYTPNIILTATNNKADNANKTNLEQLALPEQTYTGSMQGKFNIEKDRLPSPLNLSLKVGARVMLTKNDEQGRWVNGSIAVVTDLRERSVQVRMLSDHNGTVYMVTPTTWETFEYVYDPDREATVARIIGHYTQIPLMLAWAITIHKSQGKTLEKILVDLGHGAFLPGQVYVAMSRCRCLKDVRLERPLRASEIKVDPPIVRFYQRLRVE